MWPGSNLRAVGRELNDLHAIGLGQHRMLGDEVAIDDLWIPARLRLDGRRIGGDGGRREGDWSGEERGQDGRDGDRTEGFHGGLRKLWRPAAASERGSGVGKTQLQLAGASPSLAPLVTKALMSSKSSSSGTSANFSAALFWDLMLAR